MMTLDVPFTPTADGGKFGPIKALSILPGSQSVQLVLRTLDESGVEVASGQLARFVGSKPPCPQVPPPPNSSDCDAYQVPLSEILYKTGESTTARREPGVVTEVEVSLSGTESCWQMEVKNPGGQKRRFISFRLLVKFDSIQYASDDPTIILQPSVP